MWRLLDSEDLPLEWHHKFFAFILEQWTIFHHYNLQFYGSQGAGLSKLLVRIANNSTKSKMWVYICSVPAVAPDIDLARALILLAMPGLDKFGSEVAVTISERLPQLLGNL